MHNWWQDLSEAERIEYVGDINGVWIFGGVNMHFPSLSNEAKSRLYDIFKAKVANVAA